MIQTVDQMAADDHRDRTSMLVKIIATYLDNNPQSAPVAAPITANGHGTKTSTKPKKKAVSK